MKEPGCHLHPHPTPEGADTLDLLSLDPLLPPMPLCLRMCLAFYLPPLVCPGNTYLSITPQFWHQTSRKLSYIPLTFRPAPTR